MLPALTLATLKDITSSLSFFILQYLMQSAHEPVILTFDAFSITTNVFIHTLGLSACSIEQAVKTKLLCQ